MKPVPWLASEPSCLTAYRQSNPNEDTAPPTEAKDVWERFRATEGYAEIRDALVKAQGGLCVYCEQRLVNSAAALVPNDSQVEHVKAKSAGVNRTLNWQNLALCCRGGTYHYHDDATRRYVGSGSVSCGQWKDDDELGLNCDPRTFSVSPRLVNIGLNGTLSANVAACKDVGIDPAELDKTINTVLNLNCDRLRVKRKDIAENLRGWLNLIIEGLFSDSFLSVEQLGSLMALHAAGRLQPDSHGLLRAFWTTERQYLEPWSERWLKRNTHIFGFKSTSSFIDEIP